MPVALGSKPAFRCRTCGHLVGAEHASERTHPTACPVCGKGVTFAPNGEKSFDTANWEVLAGAAPDRLAELGLTPADVAAHTPVAKAENVRKAVETCQTNLAKLAAKRAHWDANKDKIVADFAALDARHEALTAKLDTVEEGSVVDVKLRHERERVNQQMQALADLEPAPRDEQTQAHLEAQLKEHQAYLAGRGSTAKPQTLQVRARDGAKTRDSSKRT